MSRLVKRPGPATLNGPIVEGFSSIVHVHGEEVMVTCADAASARAVVMFLRDRPGTPSGLVQITHTLTGQPPYYENQTKEQDLDRLIQQPAARRRATLRA